MILETDPSDGFQPVSEEEANEMLDLSGGDDAPATSRSKMDLPPAEDDGHGGDDRIDRSRAVKKRIVRLKRGFAQQQAEQEARHQREMRDLEQRLTKKFSRGDEGADADDAAHEREMETLKAEYEAALEAGQSKKAADIQARMARKEGQYWAKKTAAAMGNDPAQVRQQQQGQREPSVDDIPDPARPQPTTEGTRFIEANDWFDDEDYVAETAACVAIDKMLIRKGSNPRSPKHYQRLRAELKRKFPHLDVQTPEFMDNGGDIDDEEDFEEVDRPQRREQRRAPITRTRQEGGRPPQRQGLRQLTEAEKREMRDFRLDPNDDKAVAQWLREGAELDRKYGSRR